MTGVSAEIAVLPSPEPRQEEPGRELVGKEPEHASSDDPLIELWLPGRSSHTQRAYRADVERFRRGAGKALARVTLADLQEFANSLGDLSAASRYRLLIFDQIASGFWAPDRLLAVRCGPGAAAAFGAEQLSGTHSARSGSPPAADSRGGRTQSGSPSSFICFRGAARRSGWSALAGSAGDGGWGADYRLRQGRPNALGAVAPFRLEPVTSVAGRSVTERCGLSFPQRRRALGRFRHLAHCESRSPAGRDRSAGLPALVAGMPALRMPWIVVPPFIWCRPL